MAARPTPLPSVPRSQLRLRAFWWLTVVALIGSACGGGTAQPEPSSSTNPLAASTTSLLLTTSTAAPSTSAAFATPQTVGDLVDPTVMLLGFRFTATDLSGPELEDGYVSAGTFVSPDAFSCTLGNPAWMSPELGTITAIGTSAWWDDGFEEPHPRSRSDEFVTESFAFCPGAPEFWSTPLLDSTLVQLGTPQPSDEVPGFATMRIPLISTDSAVTIDEGSLWVTPAGWPIRLEVSGTAPGGSSSIRGGGLPRGDDLVAFEYGFELMDVEIPSLWVRAPDGSAIAGPIGEVEASLPDLPTPSDGLRQAIGLLASDRCQTESWVGSILIPLGTEAGLGEFSVSSVDPEYGFTQVLWGTFAPHSRLDDKVSTSAAPELAAEHARVYFGHIAPMVAFTWFTGLGFESTPVDADGNLDFAVWSWGSDDRIATWDGDMMRFADGREVAIAPPEMQHHVDRLPLVPDDVIDEAWAAAEDWTTAALEVADLVSTGDPQAVADMKVVAEQLRQVADIGCMLTAHAWTESDEEYDRTGDIGEEFIAEEERGQSLLLIVDYLKVMVAYLQRPEIDWLQAPGVVLNDTLGPDGSAQEYLNVIGSAAEGARMWMELMKTIAVDEG